MKTPLASLRTLPLTVAAIAVAAMVCVGCGGQSSDAGDRIATSELEVDGLRTENVRLREENAELKRLSASDQPPSEVTQSGPSRPEPIGEVARKEYPPSHVGGPLQFAFVCDLNREIDLNAIQSSFAAHSWSAEGRSGSWRVVRSARETQGALLEVSGFLDSSFGTSGPARANMGIQFLRTGRIIGFARHDVDKYVAKQGRYTGWRPLECFYLLAMENDWLQTILADSAAVQYEDSRAVKDLQRWQLYAPHAGSWTIVLDRRMQKGTNDGHFWAAKDRALPTSYGFAAAPDFAAGYILEGVNARGILVHGPRINGEEPSPTAQGNFASYLHSGTNHIEVVLGFIADTRVTPKTDQLNDRTVVLHFDAADVHGL